MRNDRVFTKAFCKRTHFYPPYELNTRGDDIKWEKGKVYNMNIIYIADKKTISCYYVNSTFCNENLFYPFSEKEFDKYFITIDEYRNSKIEKILNDK